MHLSGQGSAATGGLGRMRLLSTPSLIHYVTLGIVFPLMYPKGF